jgi:ribose-phosphate pyrophosphokinase
MIDTEGFPVTVMSVAPMLAEAIRRIHNSSSVSSLFEVQGRKLNH